MQEKDIYIFLKRDREKLGVEVLPLNEQQVPGACCPVIKVGQIWGWESSEFDFLSLRRDIYRVRI